MSRGDRNGKNLVDWHVHNCLRYISRHRSYHHRYCSGLHHGRQFGVTRMESQQQVAMLERWFFWMLGPRLVCFVRICHGRVIRSLQQ